MDELPADVRGKVANLTEALTNIESSIDATVEFANYENLSTDEKVKYDLYLSYSINSLYWTYCKLQAIDPNNVSFLPKDFTCFVYLSHEHYITSKSKPLEFYATLHQIILSF